MDVGRIQHYSHAKLGEETGGEEGGEEGGPKDVED